MKKDKLRPNIKRGDTVRLIFTGETGKVLDWYDRETVLVDVNGTDFPVFVEHLEWVCPKDFVEQGLDKESAIQNALKNAGVPNINVPKKLDAETAAAKIKAGGFHHAMPDDLPDEGVKIAMQPFYHADGLIAYFLIHFINSTGKGLLINYKMYLDTNEHAVFVLPTHYVGGRDVLILNSMQCEDMNENPELVFDIEVQGIDEQLFVKKITKSIKPKAKMLRNPPLESGRINGRAYIYELFHELPTQIPKILPTLPKADLKQVHPALLKVQLLEQRQKPPLEAEPEPKTVLNADLRVVDLHIEKLLKSYKHLSNGEILQTQLKYCQQQLDEAVRRRERSLVIIHGLGKGKLKQEVFNLLREYPQVVHYHNDFDHRFGFGATQIELNYEKA